MNPRDHLRAAARCWEHAGFFAAAAERYHQAEAWRDAGRCFSLAERHNDAAVAYSRAGERLLAAREHLMAERPERARRLFEGIQSSPFLSFSAEVELLLTLEKIEEASRLTEDPTARALFARLAASRNRPDLVWPLRGEEDWQSFASWNCSLRFHLPPTETKTGPTWPSVEFSQVSLLRIWEEETGGASFGHRALDWSADGTFFVAALGDGGLVSGRVSSEEVSLEQWSQLAPTICAKFLPKTCALLAGDKDGNVALFGAAGQVQPVDSLRMPGPVSSIEFSKQGDRLAVASGGESGGLLKIYTWSGSQPGVELSWREEEAGLCAPSCAWANDLHRFAWNPGYLKEDVEESISLNGLIFLIDQEEHQIPNAHENPILNLCFTPADRYLLSGSFDKTLVVRNGTTGQALAPPARFDDPVLGIAIHPQAAVVAVGEGPRLHMLRLLPGEVPRLSRLSEQTFDEDVTSLAFSPDGRHLLMLTSRHLRLFRVDLKP